MRALVIGGTRFLGKALVSELVKARFEVTVLNRGSNEIPYPPSIKHIIVDRTDKEQMKKVLEGGYWDVVYDLLCSTPETALDDIEIFKDKITRLVYLSSAFVYSYGQSLHEEQFDAASYQIPASFEGLGSSDARRAVEAVMMQKASFKTLAVRVPFIFGATDPSQKLQRLVRRIVMKESVYLPNTSARISVVHVDDAAKAILRMGLYPHEGAVNCAAPLALQISSLLKQIEEATYCSVRKTEQANNETVTPFSIKSDWYLDTNRMKSFEALPRNSGAWLPELINLANQEVYKGRP